MFKKIIHFQHLPLTLLILLNLIVGLIVVRDYGQSWDEPTNYEYGRFSLKNYDNLFHGLPILSFNDTEAGKDQYLDQKGPAFFMLGELFSRLATRLNPAWLPVDGWHFAYFLAFQGCIIALYFLVRRWTGNLAAFGAALLFATQPLFWGHAFINPKDVPFMAFFLASVSIGMAMVASAQEPDLKVRGFSAKLLDFLKLIFVKAEENQVIAGAIFLVVMVLILVDIATGILRAYLALFIHPYEQLVFALPVVFFGILIVTAWGSLFPTPGQAVREFFSPRVIVSGIFLGLTTSIRVLGPLAGVIVIIYALFKSRKKTVALVLPYFVFSILTCYLTWPYLWSDPVGRFLDSITVMMKYPWGGTVLFNGVTYGSTDLPNSYLPALMSIQFTEVIPILFTAGLGVSIFWFVRGRNREILPIFLVWFVLPIVALMINGGTLYDNFRQEFFLIPPVFISAGIALEALFGKIRRQVWRVVIILLLTVPGIYSAIRLHPYEYIYYNSFVGGVRGADRRFEIDYWGTSYREAAQYLNSSAPQNAKIIVQFPVEPFKIFARPDLKIYSLYDVKKDEMYDYRVIPARWNFDRRICPDAPVVKTIERYGAALTVIKKFEPGRDCP